jgi:hypothetical protein
MPANEADGPEVKVKKMHTMGKIKTNTDGEHVNDQEQIQVFKELADKSKEIGADMIRYSPGEGEDMECLFSECCDVTNDNNLIQFEDGKLALWGLKSHAKISEIDLEKVSYVHCGFDGKEYFAGFEDGSIKVFGSAKLEDVTDDYDLPNIGSKITSIVTSPDCLIFSAESGKVILYEYAFDYDDESDETHFVLHEGDGKNAVSCLKISVAKNYVYGLCNKIPDDKKFKHEVVMVWNLTTKRLVHKHDLDIDQGHSSNKNESEENDDTDGVLEDVSKLMIHHTEDASMMFIRGCFRKGVEILSFDDGVKIDEMPKMHNNSITQIILKYDKELRE